MPDPERGEKAAGEWDACIHYHRTRGYGPRGWKRTARPGVCPPSPEAVEAVCRRLEAASNFIHNGHCCGERTPEWRACSQDDCLADRLAIEAVRRRRG